jgi:PAS domain-containing protein
MVPVAHDSIVEGMNDGILVLDLQARVLYINSAAQKILKVGDGVGKSIDGDTFDWPAISRDPAAGFHQMYEIQDENHAVRYLDCHASPLHDHHEHITGQIIVLSDITERKQEQDRFRSLIGATPDGILVIDPGSMISMSNARAESMLGYSSGELNQQQLIKIIPDYSIDSPAWDPPPAERRSLYAKMVASCQ